MTDAQLQQLETGEQKIAQDQQSDDVAQAAQTKAANDLATAQTTLTSATTAASNTSDAVIVDLQAQLALLQSILAPQVAQAKQAREAAKRK